MVIDIAVIASLAHLGDVAACGSIDMALTHLTLRYPDYAAHYAAQAGAGRTVILDNSAYELADILGSGLAAAPVLKAAEMTSAAEVICTDVPYDGPATIAATRQFLDYATDAAHDVRFMAVPQGSTRAEWLACYEALARLPGVYSIGLSKLSVPRCWNAGIAAARLACAGELHQHSIPPKPLHLLGGDRCLPAELRAHRERGHTRVRSNDSSTAFWYAILGIPLDTARCITAASALPKPDLERTRLTPAQLAAAHGNINLIRDAAGLAARHAERPHT